MHTLNRQPARGRLRTLEGTIHRVDSRLLEVSAVAQGRIWRFRLAESCEMYLDSAPATLHHFRPLDRIRIVYAAQQSRYLAVALHGWEKKAAA
jgi:hypothetical protein